MSLDLTKVAAQVGAMVARLKAGDDEKQRRHQRALDILRSAIDTTQLSRKVAKSKTTWLVAGVVEGLDKRYQARPLPAEFTVIATDGSHIDVDRHQTARCFLINIGNVILHYGENAGAELSSTPHLYSSDEDLVITPEDGKGKGREIPVEGALLGFKRGVEESKQLAEISNTLPAGSKALALLDGSLILWGLEAYPEFVTETLLDKGFLRNLGEMKNANKDKQLAPASYISFPRSTDVVNTLKVALCPRDILDTDKHCPECEKRECDEVAGVRDRELFSSLLDDGERSAIFFSQSSVVRKRYGEHEIHFFYLRADDEIARVEIPKWVAMDNDLLDLTHALVLDQCQRGHGYPVALSEAHEQAVVTTSDRANFWKLVESLQVEERLTTLGSAKSRSKRTRWV